MEQRWYLRDGHSFGFDRKCQVEFGGVVLPRTDEYNTGYCLDGDIEQLRVTQIDGYGKPYQRSTGENDYLFKNIRWFNKNRQDGITNSYAYIKANLDKHEDYIIEKWNFKCLYHLVNKCCGCLINTRMVNYSTDDMAYEYLEDCNLRQSQFEFKVSELSVDRPITTTKQQNCFFAIQIIMILSNIVSFCYSCFRFMWFDNETFYGTIVLAFLIFLNALTLKLLSQSSTKTFQGRKIFRLAIICTAVTPLVFSLFLYWHIVFR